MRIQWIKGIRERGRKRKTFKRGNNTRDNTNNTCI